MEVVRPRGEGAAGGGGPPCTRLRERFDGPERANLKTWALKVRSLTSIGASDAEFCWEADSGDGEPSSPELDFRPASSGARFEQTPPHQTHPTKAALQERARALHSNRESEYHGEYYREEVSYGGAYDGDVGGTTDDAGMYEYAQHADGEAWSYQQQEDYPVPTAHGQGGWNDIADHQQCISRLTGEVENMRQKLSNLERSAAIPTHDDLAMHGQHAYGYDVTAEDAYAPEPVPTEPLGSRFFQQHGRDLDDTQVLERSGGPRWAASRRTPRRGGSTWGAVNV